MREIQVGLEKPEHTSTRWSLLTDSLTCMYMYSTMTAEMTKRSEYSVLHTHPLRTVHYAFTPPHHLCIDIRNRLHSNNSSMNNTE